jgi:membrane protein implicated in regulation of membrane protease activity
LIVSPAVSRTLTIIAAGVLAFDGAALAAMGWWSGRLMLALVGLVFFVSSALVLLYWRWYCRRLEDVTAARRALADEAREMQRLLRDR